MADESLFGPDVGPTLPPSGRGRPSRFRILATSDVHAHITPWDYHSNRASVLTGLARTASLIAKARAEVECSILVDNGDFLQGSPIGDVEALRARGLDTSLHPMIGVMNALGYDAVTLGNHEFTYGVDFLMHHLARANFPAVSANLVRKLGASPLLDDMLVPPTLVLTKDLADANGQVHPLRIGVIGLAPPQTVQWDAAVLGNDLVGRDILEAAAAHVPLLRAQGVDLVLALSHSGIGDSVATPWMENASAALAALPGIDFLVAGHTHQTFPAPDFPAGEGVDGRAGLLWGKPAVMPGFHGSHLGVIDVDLVWTGQRWQVVKGASSVKPIARRSASGQLRALTRSAPEIIALAQPAHEATRAWARRSIGHNPTDLHSYFAMISPSATVRLIARAQADFVTRALRDGIYGDLPVLSAAAPFSAGGRGGPGNYTHIRPGRMTMRHAFDLYPHPNTIAALLMTGAGLKAWLERIFSQFNQIAPGSDGAELINPNFPSFNFSTIEGLTWSVDLSIPPRCNPRGEVLHREVSRIVGLSRDGLPVTAEQRFVVASNSYQSSGGGGFVVGARADNVIMMGPQASRDILIDYIAQTSMTDSWVADPRNTATRNLAANLPPNWRFVPMPGTSVLFDSAPAAAGHLADLAPMTVEPLSLTPQGFRRFRLHL